MDKGASLTKRVSISLKTLSRQWTDPEAARRLRQGKRCEENSVPEVSVPVQRLRTARPPTDKCFPRCVRVNNSSNDLFLAQEEQ